MSFKEQLDKIFVTEEEIPTEFTLPGEVNQDTYLTNGKMVKWDGDVHEVYSPVCVRTPGGLKRKLIGTYPVCTLRKLWRHSMQPLQPMITAGESGQL
jgi:hypothetical protein